MIVGCTGLVGRTLLKIIINKKMVIEQIYLVASLSGILESVCDDDTFYQIMSMEESLNITDANLIFMCVSSDLVHKYSKIYLEYNKMAYIIDNSSYFRMHDDVDIIIPPLNGNLIVPDKRIYANSNCTTAGLMMTLYNVHQQFRLKRLFVTSFQSVSGAGISGLMKLKEESMYIPCFLDKNSKMIYNNVIPGIGKYNECSKLYEEEEKIIEETRKILKCSDLDVYATCVRCPIEWCHSISVEFEVQTDVELNDIIDVMNSQSLLKLTDEPVTHQFAKDTEYVFVSRLRENKKRFYCFITFDNLYRGASLNSFEIGDLIIQL